MTHIKTWRLTWSYDSLISAHDVGYAESLGCKVVVHDNIKTAEITGPDGRAYYYAQPSFYGLEFITRTDRQEMALLLKYGDLLELWGTKTI